MTPAPNIGQSERLAADSVAVMGMPSFRSVARGPGVTKRAHRVGLCAQGGLISIVVCCGLLAPRAFAQVPDLTVAKFQRPIAMTTGGEPYVQAKVRNRGGKAKASTVGFLLSRDRRKGGGDVGLQGGLDVPGLKRGRSAKASGTVKVPAKVKPRRYYLIACADAKRKVRERKEGNNCKASRKKTWVVAGYGTPSPLNVSVRPAESGAVTRLVTSAGATLTTTGANGTKFTLSIPPEAVLEPVEITMTPVALGGLPFASLGGAVRLGPEGLDLALPATLTITAASGSEAPYQVAFTGDGDGRDVHLIPFSAPDRRTFKLTLTHFSIEGGASATQHEFDKQGNRVPSKREAWLQQNAAKYQALLRHQQLLGQDNDDEDVRRAYAALERSMFVWENEGILPLLVRAESDDTVLAAAVREFLAWGYAVQVAGLEHLGDETVEEAVQRLSATAVSALKHGLFGAATRCFRENDPLYATQVLGLARALDLFGAGDELDDVLLEQLVERCLRFEVDFDTDLARGRDPAILRPHVRVTGVKVQCTLTQAGGPSCAGEAQPRYVSYDRPCDRNHGYGGGCGRWLITWAGPILHLPFRVNKINVATSALGRFDPIVSVEVETGNPGERFDDNCSGLPIPCFNPILYEYARSFLCAHAAERTRRGPVIDPYTLPVGSEASALAGESFLLRGFEFIGGAGVYARKQYSRTVQCFGRGGTQDELEEQTTVAVRHTPLAPPPESPGTG
jgi:hypothetical protein